MRHRTPVLLALLGLLAAGVVALLLQREQPAPAPPAASPADAGEDVLRAFAARDGAALAQLAHRTRGVRFSPAGFVDVETDRLLPPAQLATLFSDPAVVRWGYAEGSGDPIDLSGADYVAQHVPAAEALHTARVTADGTSWQSNTVNNIADVYPGGRTIEYLLEAPPGTPDRAFLTRALRLVFLEQEGRLWLVGVVLDRWSP